MRHIREKVDELRAQQKHEQKVLVSYKGYVQKYQDELLEIEGVQELFQIAVKLMYNNLSAKLGDIITEGLSLVFPDSQYRFCIEFVERRGTIEADLYLEDSAGNHYHPTDAVGGGVSDFISLLFRITYIILSPYENFLAADEPLKFIDRERIPEAARFIRKVCEDFNFQLLIVSHIPSLIEQAEIQYTIKKQRGVSIATKYYRSSNEKREKDKAEGVYSTEIK